MRLLDERDRLKEREGVARLGVRIDREPEERLGVKERPELEDELLGLLKERLELEDPEDLELDRLVPDDSFDLE